jgi:two-component system, NarL family, nitrate/nitrite response regulator NarL
MPQPAATHAPGLGQPAGQLAAPGLLRVAVASTVRLVRDGLTLSLRGRFRIKQVHAVNLDEPGFAVLARLRPDVVLIDLGTMQPGTAAAAVKAVCPSARLVAFALSEVDHAVFACAAAGFSGYVPRDSGAKELHRAVLDAADGRMHCAPHIAAAMFGRLADLMRQNTPSLPMLTGREREILELAEQGCSNKDIARRLSISSATVKNHMHSVLQKLQVSRRGQAVARLRAPRLEA